MSMVKYGRVLLDYGTPLSDVSQEWMNWADFLHAHTYGVKAKSCFGYAHPHKKKLVRFYRYVVVL